jgi:hypothetical protein
MPCWPISTSQSSCLCLCMYRDIGRSWRLTDKIVVVSLCANDCADSKEDLPRICRICISIYSKKRKQIKKRPEDLHLRIFSGERRNRVISWYSVLPSGNRTQDTSGSMIHLESNRCFSERYGREWIFEGGFTLWVLWVIHQATTLTRESLSFYRTKKIYILFMDCIGILIMISWDICYLVIPRNSLFQR